MAHNIYYREQFFSRTKNGAGAIAKASYRSGQKLYDEESMRYKNIQSNKELIAHSQIYLPDGVPERYADRQTLWNEVMSVEKQKNGQFAHEWTLSLSNDLTLDEAKKVVEEYVKHLTDQGMIVDANIHWKDGNHHVHLMSPTRGYDINRDCIEKTKCHKEKIEKDGKIIEKNISNHPEWYSKSSLKERKALWPEIQNQYLSKDGRDLVTTDSLKSQGIDRPARPYLTRLDYEEYKKIKDQPAFVEPKGYRPEDIEIRRLCDQIEAIQRQQKQIKTIDLDRVYISYLWVTPKQIESGQYTNVRLNAEYKIAQKHGYEGTKKQYCIEKYQCSSSDPRLQKAMDEYDKKHGLEVNIRVVEPKDIISKHSNNKEDMLNKLNTIQKNPELNDEFNRGFDEILRTFNSKSHGSQSKDVSDQVTAEASDNTKSFILKVLQALEFLINELLKKIRERDVIDEIKALPVNMDTAEIKNSVKNIEKDPLKVKEFNLRAKDVDIKDIPKLKEIAKDLLKKSKSKSKTIDLDDITREE